MKKIISLLLLSVMLLSLVACGDDTPSDIPEGMKLASDPEIVDYYHIREPWDLLFQHRSGVKDGFTCSFLAYSDAFQNGFDFDNKQLFSKDFTKSYIKAKP